MKIARRQLRRVIREELKLSEFRHRQKEKDQAEKERLEALVAESPDTRALGEAPFRGILQMATNAAQSRARVKLAAITGSDTVSARQIDAALEDDVYYSVMELQ